MASDIIMNIGEALVGEGNEIAHIDLLIGDQDRPGRDRLRQCARQSVSRAHQSAGRPDAQPDRQAGHRPDHQGDDQGDEAGRPDVRSRAVRRRQGRGRLRGRRHDPRRQADDLVIVCGVFIHPAAEDNAKILKYNYEATKLSIQRAMKNQPTPSEITAQKDTVKHPFAG